MGLLNPVTTVLPLRDSLQGRDRSGLFGATVTGPVRYDDAGLIVEPGTTNYCINPSFETGVAGWLNARCTIEQSTLYATSGAHTAKMVVTESGIARISSGSGNRPSTVEGDVWTISVDAASPDGMSARLAIWWYASPNGAGGVIGSTQGSFVDLAEDMGRIELTGVAPATTQSMSMVIEDVDAAIGEEFFVDAVQFERNGVATSFCPQLDPLTGNPLPGYSWAGTPHASASVRAATVLTFDPAGRVDNDSFAMVGRFSLDSITDRWQAIASAGKQDIGNFFGVFNRDDGRFSAKSNGGYAEDSLTFTPGSPQIAYVAGKDTDWIGQLDDNTPITDTRSDGGAWSNSNVYIGSTNNGDYLNGSVGPVAFYDRPLTDVELDKVKAAISLGRNPWGLLAPKKQYSFFQLRPGV